MNYPHGSMKIFVSCLSVQLTGVPRSFWPLWLLAVLWTGLDLPLSTQGLENQPDQEVIVLGQRDDHEDFVVIPSIG
jgi:hypothetical protein